MVRYLIRSLLHSFKRKEFYNTKAVERPNIKFSRILSISNHKLRNSRIPTETRFSSYKRVLIKSEMPKVKSGFYAVRVGRIPGVYQSWEECEKQVKKYLGAKYKKFSTLQEAETFVKEGNNKKVELFLENSTQELPLHNSSKQHSIPSSPVHLPASNVNNGKPLRVWTDGSSHNNGQHGARAGVGVYWGKDNPCNVSERLPGLKQTNNRAEIMAVIRALETCPNNNVPLEIRTDSKYTINAFTSWIPKWEKNNWKTTNNKEVENKELFQRLMKLVKARNAGVILEYVPGHVGVKENEEADKLANLGSMLNAIDDPYDYGEKSDEESKITEELSFLDATSQNSEIQSINENYRILLNNLEYNLTKDDLFSAEEKLEIENETGMKFV